MKQNLYDLFLDELADMYSAENQLVNALPKVIQAVTTPDLKEALSNHLRETENHVVRIEKIYSILGVTPKEETCEAMEGLIEEANQLIGEGTRSLTMDAGIISACQKVEHYEIASYGTLRSFAKFLNLDSNISDLITDTLNEEGAADKKLTKIAEGSFFSSGINKEAAGAVAGMQRNRGNRF